MWTDPEVAAAYRRRHRAEKKAGMVHMVDAAPARAHVAECVAFGMTLRAIAAEAGLTYRVIQALSQGQKACRSWTAEAVLGVQVSAEARGYEGTRNPLVPARGTTRRLQALLAIGWTHPLMTERCGLYTGLLLRSQAHVTTRNHQIIAALYDRLCMTPGPSQVTRLRAAKKGYAPPLAWDDIDRDRQPATGDSLEDAGEGEEDVVDEVLVERILAGERMPCTKPERYEVIRRWRDAGRSLNELIRVTGWQVYREINEMEAAA
jgi:hypothetical protein